MFSLVTNLLILFGATIVAMQARLIYWLNGWFCHVPYAYGGWFLNKNQLIALGDCSPRAVGGVASLLIFK